MKYQTLNKYLMVFSDCIVTKGVVNSTICDISRQQIEVFSSSYYELLGEFKINKVSEVFNSYDEEAHENIASFIDFLLEKEYCTFVDDLSPFPEIKKEFQSPEKINNAIIDIDSVKFNFEAIVKQLDELECIFLQLRLFSNLYSLEELSAILQLMLDTSIEGVELILKYNPACSDQEYISFYEQHLLLSSLLMHSAPSDRTLEVLYGYSGDSEDITAGIKKNIFFVEERMENAKKCGKINKNYFCVGNITDLMHNACYNSCLNKKISIDAGGEIKNCPSMIKSFGNIAVNSLGDAYSSPVFKDLWSVNKNKINVCKVCEFRSVCTDCRAYTEDPFNIYSKPLKCGYNPYTGSWEDWKSDPAKEAAMEFYGIQ